MEACVKTEIESDDYFWGQPIEMSAAMRETMEKLKKSYCSVLNCSNNSTHNPELSFFKLPSDPVRAAQWLDKVQRVKGITKKMLFCEEHFERRYVNVNESRKRLVTHAVPTLRLSDAVTLECTPDVDLVAAPDTMDIDLPTIAKPPPRLTVTGAKHIIRTFGRCNENANGAEKYIARMIKLSKKFRLPYEGEKITDSFKFFALKLYISNPKTYKVMQPILNLPPISTLYRLYIPTSTELCENLIIALQIKVDSMTERQKQCAVCICAVELKEHLFYDTKKDEIIGFHEVDGAPRLKPADTALIVMVRGLYDNWKQAISFSLLAKYEDDENVKHYIFNIIHKLFEIGLNVRVFISDIESEFIGISKEKNISLESPFFTLDERKVYYMYDPANLLKSIREGFTTHEFHFNNMIAKWEHIAACYEHDHKSALRLAPRLRCYDTHLQSGKELIKFATQVFSKTTAAAISTYADLNVIDTSAKQTVQWILMINKLFHLLNFNNLDFDGETKSPFSGEKAEVDFFNEIISTLNNLRLIDTKNGTGDTQHVKFIDKLQVTIKVVQTLHQELKDVNSEVPIIGLNQDCLDTFLDKVHQKYGRYPTSRQIRLKMSRLPIFNVFHWQGKIKENVDLFLNEAMTNSHMNMYERGYHKVDSVEAGYTVPDNIASYAAEVVNESALHRMAAYLLYEGYQRHNDCEIMRAYTFENSDSSTVILNIKALHELGNTVTVTVPPEFIDFVETMELALKLYIETDYQRNALRGLKEHLFAQNITFSMPCECFPLDYIKVLFMRYRFHTLMKYNNREFQNMKPNRKCFVVNEL